MKTKRYVLPWKRRREGKTNYRKRLSLLKSGKPRLVVRRSLRYITAQIITYTPGGDQTIVSCSTKQLKSYGWNGYGRNTTTAYLIGYLCGFKAKQKNLSEAVLDIGMYPPRQGTVIFGVLKGAVDAGLQIPHDPSIFPSEDRIHGSHISKDIKNMVLIVKENIEKQSEVNHGSASQKKH